MFPDLPSFSQQTNDACKAVQQLGAQNGLLDAHDQLTDPVASITNPGTVNRDNPAAFDLDSVYGDGPKGSSQLYETVNGRIKFILQRIPGSETPGIGEQDARVGI